MRDEAYVEMGGRCKKILYLHRHRVVKTKGRGNRCKYCDRTISDLRQEAERGESSWR